MFNTNYRFISVILSCAAIFFSTIASAGQWDTPARFLFTIAKESPQVTVIDIEKDLVVGNIKTSWPVSEIVVSGFGDYAFAGHANQKKISVINLKQGEIERVLDVPVAPRNMSADIYAGVLISDDVDGGVALIDITGREVRFSNLDIVPSQDMIFGPTGAIAYYYSGPGGVVGALSMNNGRQLWKANVPKDSNTIPLVRSLDGLFIVFVLPERGEIHALNSSNGQLIASQRLGEGLSRPYVTANGQYFLVPQSTSSQVHLLSQSTFTHISSFTTNQPAPLVTAGLFDLIALAYSDSALYAMDLVKRDGKHNKIELPGQASDVIVSSDSTQVFATIPNAKTIVHLDLKSGNVSYIKGLNKINTLSMGASNSICH